MELPSPSQVPASKPPLPVLPSPRKIRALGWLLIIVGLILALGTSRIAYGLHEVIAHQAEKGATTSWNGDPEMTRLTFELFGALVLFGLVSSVTGIYQVVTGSRHRFLAGVMLVVLVGVVYFGYQIMTIHKLAG